MPVHVTARWLSRTCLVGLLLIAAVASNVMAEPGPPWVVFNPDSSVVVNYTPVTPVPPGGAFLAATYNGAPIPGSPFFIGQATAVVSPPLAPGSYTVQVIYADGSVSPVFNFGLGFPSAPTIRVASADLDTAVLFWTPGGRPDQLLPGGSHRAPDRPGRLDPGRQRSRCQFQARASWSVPGACSRRQPVRRRALFRTISRHRRRHRLRRW